MPVKDMWFYFSRGVIVILAALFLLFVAEFEGVRAVYEQY